MPTKITLSHVQNAALRQALRAYNTNADDKISREDFPGEATDVAERRMDAWARFATPGSGTPALAGYRDASSALAVEALRVGPRPITSSALADAVDHGARDGDSKSAAAEFDDFRGFAFSNWAAFDLNGKAAFRIYQRHAKKARDAGKTSVQNFDGMLAEMRAAAYKDESAMEAIEVLKGGPVPVTLAAMADAIDAGVRDVDSSSAGPEIEDFQAYATASWASLSLNAKAAVRVYQRHAHSAQTNGRTGVADFDGMLAEIRALHYRDESAMEAIESLKAGPRAISAARLTDAIEQGARDTDTSSAGPEFADFLDFAHGHWAALQLNAKAVVRIYQRHAKSAGDAGKTSVQNFDGMLAEMRAAAYRDEGAMEAIEKLKAGPRPIAGDAMTAAIVEGTADFDGHATTDEFHDFKTLRDHHGSLLSQEAKDKVAVYERHVNMGSGYNHERMLAELRS